MIVISNRMPLRLQIFPLFWPHDLESSFLYKPQIRNRHSAIFLTLFCVLIHYFALDMMNQAQDKSVMASLSKSRNSHFFITWKGGPCSVFIQVHESKSTSDFPAQASTDGVREGQECLVSVAEPSQGTHPSLFPSFLEKKKANEGRGCKNVPKVDLQIIKTIIPFPLETLP